MTANDFAFSPDSELWLVNRYANGLLFGPAAVLLQVAHPRVAQGGIIQIFERMHWGGYAEHFRP
tara:strand:- start:5153 stop:5344 length:192 start_codon:yes stop_codon:yes gene_type:complete